MTEPFGSILTSVSDNCDGPDSLSIVQSETSVDVSNVHQVSATVTDMAGLSSVCSTDVIIYDPSAGFVTGGGESKLAGWMCWFRVSLSASSSPIFALFRLDYIAASDFLCS